MSHVVEAPPEIQPALVTADPAPPLYKDERSPAIESSPVPSWLRYSSPPQPETQFLLADSALGGGGSAALMLQPARAGESALALDWINQVLAAEGFAVDLQRDAIWGYVNPNDAITVTRTSDGAYGAAEADGVGFFWTPLWDAGHSVDILAGDQIKVYVNGALEATINPLAITGQVNLLTDTVTGTVSGLTAGTVVTATMLDVTWTRYDLVVGSDPVDASGNFTIDFSGVDNIGPHEMAQVFYHDANGNAVVDYVYPYGAFRVNGWNRVEGFASEGANVDVTVYITYPTDVRWSDSTGVGNPPFYQFNGNIEYGDVAEVVIDSLTTYSVTAHYMDMRPDAANDQITGIAPAAATVRAQLRDDFDGVAEDAETVADGSWAYTITLGTDLRTGHYPYVGYIDDEGNEVGYSIGPPHIRAYPMQNRFFAVANRPHQAVTYTLDTGSEVFTMTGWCHATNNCDHMWVESLEPGMAITVELEDMTMDMIVPNVSLETDPAANTVYGDADIDGQVDVTIGQWNDGHYPANGWATTGAIASSPFTATFDGFDVRDAMFLFAYHYDAVHGNRTLIGHGNWETAYFRAYPQYNSVGGVPPTADAPVTARLYDSDGATLLETASYDYDGNPWWFWLGFNTDIQAGHWITVTSGGWEAGLQVPELTLEYDLDSDTIWGEAPKALVFVEGGNSSGGFGGFVPSDGYLLDTAAEYGWDLQWGDYMAATYQAPNGNLVQVEFYWPGINAHYRMDGSSEVSGWNATPGNTVQITVAHPVSGVVAAGTTVVGECSYRDSRGYCLEMDEGVIAPDNVVTVDFGDGLVNSLTVVSITVETDVDTDVITVTTPPDIPLYLMIDGPNGWWGSWEHYEQPPMVGASGYVTFELGAHGYDVVPGTEFTIWAHHTDSTATQYTWWLPAPELWLSKNTTWGVARPGDTFLYQFDYGNNGSRDGVAENAIIVDTLPPSTTYAYNSQNLVVIDGGDVITIQLGDLPPGANERLFVALWVDSNVPTQTNLAANCAYIDTDSPGDWDPGNNATCSGEAWVDWDGRGVWVNKWPEPNDPAPGEEFSYYINLGSEGGNACGPTWLTDTFPISTTFVRWDEVWGNDALWVEVEASDERLVLHAPAGLPGHWGGRIRVVLRVDPDVDIGTRLENHVVLVPPEDDNWSNNQHTNNDAVVGAPRYDLQVYKYSGSGIQTPGGNLNYWLHYENRGNVAIHAWLTDTLPVSTTYQPGSAGWWDQSGWTRFDPVTVTEEYVVWDLGIVGVGQGQGFGFNVDVDPLAATGPITNCAAVGSAYPESTPEDNTACVVDTIYPPGPNLRVIKGHEWHDDNSRLSYWVEVYNIGDVTVENVLITDTYPFSTTFNGEWWEEWGRPFDLQFTDNYTDGQLLWELEYLDSGWGWRGRFNVDLDEHGAPLRWYTNTVEVAPLAGDANPADNIYEDVAFSGGEVQWVDFDVYRTRVWGCGYDTPIVVSTALTEVVFWDACWNEHNFPDTFDPGDVITVTAGAGTLPVVATVPDPFIVHASSITDTVWGQVDHLDREIVEVDLWGFPTRYVETDEYGHFSATYTDVPRGAMGDIGYWTEISYARVGFHGRFQTPDLALNINYDHDWVEGNYESGHTVWLTVTDSLSAIRATAELTTGVIPWWGGQTGFSTNLGDPWQPQRPNIQPYDWVDAATETGYTATVHLGLIAGFVDVNADRITGTVDAPWLMPGPVQVECHTWGAPGGAPHRSDWVTPDGSDVYSCAWNPATEWDVQPGQDIGVTYREPDGHQIFAVFREPVPHLRVEKWWADGGGPGEGGNALFYVQYRNQGDGDAVNVVITDTLQGMTYLTDTSGLPFTGGGGQVVWNLGTVAPGDWVWFYVFAEITVSQGEWITNTVEIATSDPYDQGDEWEKRSEWSGEVWSNDTQLRVEKWAWTGDPAPGAPVVFHVNVCNNGGTASTQVVLTDTLHPSMTLQTWWSDTPGWVEVISSPHELVVTKPAFAGWRCEGVYVRAKVTAAAWPGLELWNHAVITAANDLSTGDDEAWWWGSVAEPRTNLLIDKQWNWGQLTPGGELRYSVNYNNTGNVPVGTFHITDTLPVSTTFDSAWQGGNPLTPILIQDNIVVWEFAGLDNGFANGFEIILHVDPDAIPGTVLLNSAEITCLPGEETCDDNVRSWTETLFDHGPNLRVTKWGDWHGDRPGHAWYNFRVENVGDIPIAQAVVTDTYPALMTLEGDINTDWSRVAGYTENPAEHWFEFTLNDVWPGYRLDFNFNTTMEEPVAEGLILTNTVAAAPVAGDTNPSDDSADYVLTTGPDLYVQKTLIDGVVRPGELVTFSLIFGNDQPGHTGWWNMEGDARLTDVLPGGWTYISAKLRFCDGSEWCDRPPDYQFGSFQLWLFDPLNTSAWNEIHLAARVPYTATGLDTFTNRAEIASSQPTHDVEPDYDNNIALAEVKVDLPYFEVSKDYESTAIAGMPITYTLTVTNIGNSVGTGVILSDTIPAGLENVEGGTLMPPWMWWYIDSLAPNGGVATETFAATLPCVVGTVVNDDYRVVDSDQGVSSAVGAPISVDVLAPTLNVGFDQSAVTALVSTTLRFTDTSTTNGPAIAAWAWDFDDGHSASGANVAHTYTTDGVFTVRLTITDTCGYTATTTSVVTVTAPALVASFDQSMDSAVVSTTLYFTDTSTTNAPPIVAWAWDFGDESAPVFSQNAAHIYTTDGVFTVRLTVTDTLGYAATTTGVVTITAPTLVASFNQSAVNAVVGTTVYFTDTSTTDAAPIIAWAWDFGDSATSTAQNPTHQYNMVGEFTITLVVTDALGYSDVATSTLTVTSACIPLTAVSFTYQPASVLVNSLITFTATYSPANATSPITYDWSFGDGQAAVIVTTPVTHTYATIGEKTVQLTARNSCTPGGVTSQQIINVKSSSYSIFLPLVLRNY